MFLAIALSIGAALHVLGVIGAIDVIMKGRTAPGTTAWALALVFVPLIAVPMYIVFGERKFAGYVRARRTGMRQIDQAARALAEALGPHTWTEKEGRPELDALVRLARMPFTRGNRVELLIDGAEMFPAMYAAIDAAREYALVQFYMFQDDEVGRALAEALLRARGRGVRVMLLYDEIGSYTLPNAYLERLRAAGCECSGFRTKPKRQKRFRINFRNHRKIVVVDGTTALMGGINVGREYLGLDPRVGRWRDTHVKIVGPAAQCLQLSFLEDWYWANRRVPELRWEPAAEEKGACGALVVPSGPADELDTCSLMYTHVANCARKRLWLATPYFVPDEEVLGAIQLAALRGVDVRVIVPEKNDNMMVQYSILSFYEDLMTAGARVYHYTDGFMHQKVALCDDVSVVSTANLDNRSFRINFEVSTVVQCPDFAEGVRVMLETDMARSREVTTAWMRGMSLRTRFLSRFFRLFAPVQ